MSVIIERLELTDEQVKWAKRLSHGHMAGCMRTDCGIAGAVVAALPQPTLRERAYKVVFPELAHVAYKNTSWASIKGDQQAIEHMARWLYENAGERRWWVTATGTGTYWAGNSSSPEGEHDNLVDAYAHVVVGLAQ